MCPTSGTGSSTGPPNLHCAKCASTLLPDIPYISRMWGKRCQECRARFCRRCTNRFVRQLASGPNILRTKSHESGHGLLGALDLGDAAVTAALGGYEPKAAAGLWSPGPGAYVADGIAYFDVQEAVAETFARYVMDPDAMGDEAISWLRASLARAGPPYWRETIRELRDDPGWNIADALYHCGYCGHHWSEIGGSGMA